VKLLFIESVGVVFSLGCFIYYQREFSEPLHMEFITILERKKDRSNLRMVHSIKRVI
jgi:hypothetical protein